MVLLNGFIIYMYSFYVYYSQKARLAFSQQWTLPVVAAAPWTPTASSRDSTPGLPVRRPPTSHFRKPTTIWCWQGQNHWEYLNMTLLKASRTHMVKSDKTCNIIIIYIFLSAFNSTTFVRHMVIRKHCVWFVKTSRTVMLYPSVTSKRRSFFVFFHFGEVSYIYLQVFC